MNHEQAQSLLGACALDAIEPTEVEPLQQHLSVCPRCRHELAALEEAAAWLGNAGGEAPPHLWSRIAEHVEGEPPALRVAGGRELSARRRAAEGWRTRIGLVAVAAAVAAVAFLGWDVAHLNGRVGHLQAAVAQAGVAQAAEAAALSPSSRHVELRSSSGALEAQVSVRPDGQAYVVSTTLPRLASGRTYQIWGIVNGRIVSLGLLGGGGSPAAFRLGRQTSALMVTAEPSGGVPAPTTPVLVKATV